MPRPPAAAPEKSTIVLLSALGRRALGFFSFVAPGPVAALAERLFFTPPRPRRSRGEALLRSGPRHGVMVGGHRVAAWRFGRGPVVLLVHGWAGRAAQMTAFVGPLVARGFSVVAFDAPGHGASGRGLSSAVDFARAIRALEREYGVFHAVVAHSLGAAATALALAGGVSARRLVFLGPAAVPPAWALGFARQWGLTDDVMARMRVRSERRLGLPWEELDVPRLGRGRGEPLLVVHDRHDTEVPFADGRRIASAWSGARLVETTGLGHQRILRDAAVVQHAIGFVAEDAPEACACGAATAQTCESCRLERELFLREARWAAPGDASIGSWSGSSVPRSTSAP